MANKAKKGEMSTVEFTHKAIVALRTEGYKGCHTVYSGFNAAFREYFGKDPIETTTAMHKNGDIFMHGARGGAMIYLMADKPASNRTDGGKSALAKMGL